MSPDVFLSRNQIRYDLFGAFSPAQTVAALLALNATRTWYSETQDFDYTTYRPAPTAAPLNPNSFNPAWVAAENTAVAHYLDLLRTCGDPVKIRAAVDAVNAIRAVVGGSVLIPPSDFDIRAHGNSVAAQVARAIISQREPNDDGETIIPWFDTKAAFDALSAYASQS